MAYKEIGTQGSESVKKPWLEEYLETLDRKTLKKMDNSSHEVTMLSMGRRGITVSTELFVVFVWKSSELYSHLTEAMDVWATGKTVDALVVLVKEASEATYALAMDDERKVSWDTHKRGKKLTNSTSETSTDVEPSVNPFL